MGQFADDLKTSIIDGFAYTGLRDAYFELLHNIRSLLKESNVSRPNTSTSHGKDTIHYGLYASRITEQVEQEVNYVHMDLFSVAYISGFIVIHVLRAVRCDDCKTCLTFPMTMPINAFINFKELKDS